MVSIASAVMALLLLPRAYDYDKVLFYPLGLMLCWRYVDRPVAARLWACAAGLVVAALFRYDNGVFLGAAMAVTIVVAHTGDWGLVVRRLGGLLIAIACLALPILVFIQFQIGLGDVIDQAITYGRRETARTQLSAQRFVFESFQDLPSPHNADVFLFHIVRLMPLAGALALVLDLRSGRATRKKVAELCRPGDPLRLPERVHPQGSDWREAWWNGWSGCDPDGLDRPADVARVDSGTVRRRCRARADRMEHPGIGRLEGTHHHPDGSALRVWCGGSPPGRRRRLRSTASRIGPLWGLRDTCASARHRRTGCSPRGSFPISTSTRRGASRAASWPSSAATGPKKGFSVAASRLWRRSLCRLSSPAPATNALERTTR